LIRLRFGPSIIRDCKNPAATQQSTQGLQKQKNSLANFSSRDNLMARAEVLPLQPRRAKMAWKAPKIVEVPCGMEINMYVSATRK
jgi:coenzyme PQQ precursor peptide PqqA